MKQDREFMIRIYGLDTSTEDDVMFCKNFDSSKFNHRMYSRLQADLRQWVDYNSFDGKYYINELGKILAS